MKQSNYNFFYPFKGDNSQTIIFNTRTNNLALLEADNYTSFMEFINNNTPIADESFVKDLKRGGYIIEDNVNESELIKFNSLKQKYSTGSLGLTIAPTLNCNFDCVYCYEKENRKSSRMSKEVQDKIVEMVKNGANYIGNLDVTWYGGEPLLEVDIIESIAKQLIDICSDKDIKYSSGIITNGYNLTRDVALKLKELKVNSVQVTLDGPREIHDKRRPLVGGKGSFDEIMKRVSECSDILKIALRINTDNDNVSFLEEILDTLEQYNLKNKVAVYLGYVEPINDCYNKDACMAFDYFSKLSLDFTDVIIKRGFEKDIMMKYPKARGCYCGADALASYVIDPNGDIYKCWSDIGMKEYSTGNLLDNQLDMGNFSRLTSFMLYDPTSDPECAECKFLPICMGGCPKRRLSEGIDRCTEFKYILETYMQRVAVIMNARQCSDGCAQC